MRLFAAVALAAALGSPAVAQDAPEPLAVTATPIGRFDANTPVGGAYGKLTFLGGVKLASPDKDFGGLSGLRVDADGRGFTVVSDRGNWHRGEMIYEGSRLVAVENMRRLATPGRDGKPLPGRKGFDTEGLEIEGRAAWVTSERVNWLTRYALDAEGFPSGPGQAVALPKAAAGVGRNAGYESVARTKSGGLLLIAQSSRGADTDFSAFVVGGKQPFSLAVKRSDDFRPTDVTRLPGGGYVLLERRYRPPFSLSVRMKRIAEADVAPGAVLDGELLMEASLAQTIDNFEGLSAHRDADGRTVLTVVSDDNFHPLQRTMLLQFALER